MKKKQSPDYQVIFDRKLQEIRNKFGTEDVCKEYLYDWQLRRGCKCPYCGYNYFYYIRQRSFLQCKKCKRQFSLRIGTIFYKSQMSLVEWFTMVLLTFQSEIEISTQELKDRLKLDYYDTAWKMRKKIDDELHPLKKNPLPKFADLITWRDIAYRLFKVAADSTIREEKLVSHMLRVWGLKEKRKKDKKKK